MYVAQISFYYQWYIVATTSTPYVVSARPLHDLFDQLLTQYQLFFGLGVVLLLKV